MLNLDSEPSAEALAEVRNHPAITSASSSDYRRRGSCRSWLQG